MRLVSCRGNTRVRNATPTNVISQFDYTYDAAGRRVSIAKSGTAFGDLSGSVDAYTYNTRSELTSARRTKGGQPIPGFSEDFDYDPIGNRRSSSTYNEKGEAQTSTYLANNLNQYTSRTSPGYAAVRGEADPNAFVSINGNEAYRLGSYYFGSDLFDNNSAGGLANLETYATLNQFAANGDEAEDLVSVETNQVYLAKSPETFEYDNDGNQTLITTKTGLWRVTYNGENRPILWVRDSDNTTLSMCYDHMGRRRTKNNQQFFYDGYLQVVDSCSNAYIWDCTEPVATRPLAWFRDNSFGYYAHDGNKNVSEVMATDGIIAAHYEYAPFGAVTTQRGEFATSNPWRFSSEFADDKLSSVYYNYRHYEPMSGRWLSRDVDEDAERSGLYKGVSSPIGSVDILGKNEPSSFLDGIQNADEAMRLIKEHFPNAPQRQIREIRRWEKKVGIRKSHLRKLMSVTKKCGISTIKGVGRAVRFCAGAGLLALQIIFSPSAIGAEPDMQDLELYWDNREVFSDDCKDIDTKIEDTKREMLEEWKDIPDANK